MLLSKIYDPLMMPLEQAVLKKKRKALLRHAAGRVLEIGSGSGLSFPHYPAHVTSFDAIEPDDRMRERSLPRLLRSRLPGMVQKGKAERLPFGDHSFDTIVVQLVLCSVEDPLQALEEIKRTAAPGAKILLLEHVRPPAGGAAADLLTPCWRNVCGNCHLNRETDKLMAAGGFHLEAVDGRVLLSIHASLDRQ
ncbi:class I SAM-dependent methyltransferase [Alkalicoccus chagannorensis]|uniref:class I SAM-dependent methyltransferase n=1 Tax=Alkalicoccus chagannorensis TaxID=427072 RepID=UPI0004146422|nr:class I SAM-dependent methyltransferase [Alkalicoccus chagannorensis]